MLAQIGDNNIVTDLALLFLSVGAVVISFLFGIVAISQAFKLPRLGLKTLAAAMFPLIVGIIVFIAWMSSGWSFGPWLLFPIASAVLGGVGTLVWIWRRFMQSTTKIL